MIQVNKNSSSLFVTTLIDPSNSVTGSTPPAPRIIKLLKRNINFPIELPSRGSYTFCMFYFYGEENISPLQLCWTYHTVHLTESSGSPKKLEREYFHLFICPRNRLKFVFVPGRCRFVHRKSTVEIHHSAIIYFMAFHCLNPVQRWSSRWSRGRLTELFPSNSTMCFQWKWSNVDCFIKFMQRRTFTCLFIFELSLPKKSFISPYMAPEKVASPIYFATVQKHRTELLVVYIRLAHTTAEHREKT